SRWRWSLSRSRSFAGLELYPEPRADCATVGRAGRGAGSPGHTAQRLPERREVRGSPLLRPRPEDYTVQPDLEPGGGPRFAAQPRRASELPFQPDFQAICYRSAIGVCREFIASAHELGREPLLRIRIHAALPAPGALRAESFLRPQPHGGQPEQPRANLCALRTTGH